MPDKIQRARQFAKQLFEESATGNAPITETILIRGGHYCGHRFRCGDLHAVWFSEEDQVKLYNKDRELLRVEDLSPSHFRRAA